MHDLHVTPKYKCLETELFPSEVTGNETADHLCRMYKAFKSCVDEETNAKFHFNT